MRTVNDLKVGDEVHWTDVNRKGLHSGTVTKVGTKLITVGQKCSALVFRKDTLHTNDNYSHQRLVTDVAAHIEQQEVTRIRNAIYRAGGGSKDIPLEDAKTAARLLKVEWE
jgi:hypothetical protein